MSSALCPRPPSYTSTLWYSTFLCYSKHGKISPLLHHREGGSTLSPVDHIFAQHSQVPLSEPSCFAMLQHTVGVGHQYQEGQDMVAAEIIEFRYQHSGGTSYKTFVHF